MDESSETSLIAPRRPWRNLHFKVRHLCLAVIPLGIVAYLAMGNRFTGDYCTRCGLMRHTRARTCFGFVGQTRVSYSETEFHRLYQSASTSECDHNWQPYTNGHFGAPGAVFRPIVLMSLMEDSLHRLTRLKDPAKVLAVLASFDLMQSHDDDNAFLNAIGPAFDDLKNVHDASSEEEWWVKHGHVFLDGNPPLKTIRRPQP